MKCDKCDGVGWNDNPKYWDKRYDSYILHDPRINCRKCKGTGYVIGNIKEVFGFLKVLEDRFNHDKEVLKEIKQCIDAIEK